MRKWILLLATLVTVDISILVLLWSTAKEVKKKPAETKSIVTIPITSRLQSPIKLMLLGDVMLGRTVNSFSLDQGNPDYPFEKIAGKIRNEDIVFANLESPFVTDCPRIEEGYTFCADPRMIDGMVFSGIDVVSLANNHNLNFGQEGVDDTITLLDSKGIKWTGKGNLAVIEKRGIKFGFLGFDFVSRSPLQSDWDLIKESDPKVDILVVGVHWGEEYKAVASKLQREWALKMIENGADIVVGHHPHWIQDTECFEYVPPGRWNSFAPGVNGCLSGSVPVYYSLGNFIFDQMWSEETRKGLAIELEFDGNQIVNEERLPVYIDDWAQPEWVDED